MGFLDSLVRRSSNAITNATARAVGNVVGDLVEDAAGDFVKGLRKSGDKNNNTPAAPNTQTVQEERETDAP